MKAQENEDSGERTLGTTAKRTLVVVGIIALALFLWQIVDALLLMFIGVLIAVLLHGLAKRLSARIPLSTSWSLAIVGLVLTGVLAGTAFLLGPRIAEQYTELVQTLPQSINQLKEGLQQTTWGKYLLEEVQSSNGELRAGGDVFSRLTGMASRALGMFTNTLLILFAAIFFAASPNLYKNGFVLLVPAGRADRVREALDASGHALWIG